MNDKDKKLNVLLNQRTISRSLPISLLRTREHVMVPIRPILSKIGISEQKWRILRVLGEDGPIEQSTIARKVCLLLPSLTRILHKMEQDGQIIRWQDKTDRRRTLVNNTEIGNDIINSQLPATTKIYKTLEKKLGTRKLEKLLDLLEEIQNIKF
ncbi:MAG: homoprotocatechuate degradation operon regulator HpaR [Rhizobiales bacterium]|nr:homoprotocatechuate degradation operon regulator HpaR [Hyphomicrobiales bacterium]